MQKRTKVILSFAFLVILVIGLYIFSEWFSKTTGYIVGEDADDRLAKCMTEKGARFYGSKSCPDCRKQESLFGLSAFKYINYVDCYKYPRLCGDLKSIPAWEINGRILYGVRMLNELRIFSNCAEE